MTKGIKCASQLCIAVSLLILLKFLKYFTFFWSNQINSLNHYSIPVSVKFHSLFPKILPNWLKIEHFNLSLFSNVSWVMEFLTLAWFYQKMHGLQGNCCILWFDISPSTSNWWILSFQSQFSISKIIFISYLTLNDAGLFFC